MARSFQTPENDVLRHLLREVRERSGVSQHQLSLRLGEPDNFGHRVETGDRGINLFQILGWLKITGMDREVFFKDLFDRLDRL